MEAQSTQAHETTDTQEPVNKEEQKPTDSPDLAACQKSLRGLDALNFLMADTQTGVGPFLAIFLKNVRHYDPGRIGMVMGVGSIAQVLMQTPAGAFIDRTRHKRLLVAVAAGLVGASALIFVFMPQLWAVMLAQVLLASTGAVFGPAIAALSLGIVGHKYLMQRQSRNEAFNHFGNVAAAILYAIIGFKVAQQGIFWCVAVFSIVTVFSVFLIQQKDIDDRRASGAEEETAPEESANREHQSRTAKEEGENRTEGKKEAGKPEGLLALWKDKRLLIFVVTVILFHSANAAMLPLVGEVLGAGKSQSAVMYMSAIIIVSQLTMIPVALFVGKLGKTMGRKPIFLVGIASVAMRGVLFAIFKNSYALVAIQVLDGIGAGIFGVLNVIIIADLTRGTGRFNFAQGAIATSTGIGASVSNLGTGFLVKHSGFPIGFLTLAGVAMGAFVFAWFWLPETRDAGEPGPGEPTALPGDDPAFVYRTIEDTGPIVMVTHPRETLLATGPQHIVSGSDTVRVRTWSEQPVTAVRYRVDGQDWLALSKSPDGEWSGDLSAEGLVKGSHRLEIEAVDTDKQVGRQQQTFMFDPTGRYNPVPMVQPLVTQTRFC